MAATKSRRLRLAREIGMYFAELGHIPTRTEYSRLRDRPKFLNVKEVDRICGSWPKMLSILEKEQPEIWELIHKAPEPKKPPIEEKMEKAKPAKKAEPEGANGKSI
tara:strand:+ start:1615 stop:1932 length:318 start_codon:yes stop_codon:yes gene_type:complete